MDATVEMWCRPPSTTPCHPPTIYLQDSLVLIFGINYTIQLQLISYVNTSNKSKDILVSCSWNYCQAPGPGLYQHGPQPGQPGNQLGQT